MHITINPIRDIECTPYQFEGRDGKPVTIYTGRGVCNPEDPIAVRVTSRRECLLAAGVDVHVVLREYSSKGDIPVAKVAV